MIDTKVNKRNSTGVCRSQSSKGSTQVGKAGVLVPVKSWNRGCQCGCYSKGDSNNGFSWSYTRGVTSGDKRLR